MAQVVVACPNCSTKLSIHRTTTNAVQFKCTRCGRLLKLAAKTASTTSSASTPKSNTAQRPAQSQRPAPEASGGALSNFDFGNLPTAPTAPQYRDSYMVSNHAARRKPTRCMNWKPLMVGIGCMLGIAGLGFAGIAAYRWLPAGLISNLNPLGDSHASVLRRLNDIASNMVDVLDSIQDDSGRRTAIGKLQALSSEARELQHRATRLGEIDEQEFNRLASQFNSDAAATKERMRTAVANLRQRSQLSGELSESSIAMAFAMDDVAMAIQIGWKKLPVPENKAEQLARDKVEIQRDIWREVAAVTSKDQYDKLPNRLASFPRRYQKLHNLQKEVTKQGSFSENFVTKYTKVWFDVSFQLSDLKNKQETLYGSNPALQAQLDAIQQAEAELVGMQMLAHSQPNNGMPMSGGPPRTGIPSGSQGFPRTAEEAFSQSLNQFTQRHGAENTVILRINSTLNLQSQAGEIVDKVAAIQANGPGKNRKNFFAPRDGNTTTIVFTYIGAVDEVVSRIDFGKVVSVDSHKREIVVDYAD